MRDEIIFNVFGYVPYVLIFAFGILFSEYYRYFIVELNILWNQPGKVFPIFIIGPLVITFSFLCLLGWFFFIKPLKIEEIRIMDLKKELLQRESGE